MNEVFSYQQDRHPTGLVFTELFASAIGLFIVAATLAIFFFSTPTLSNKATATVADTVAASACGVSPFMKPLS